MGAQAKRLGRFIFCRPLGSFPAGIFLLEKSEMNFVWLCALAALGLAFQTTKDTKYEKRAQSWSPVPQEHNRVRHSYVQTIHAPADMVFAVLEPVEEVKWAPGFEFEWVYAKEGPQAKAGQDGDVFITRHHSGLGSQSTAIWVISRRDAKERRVQFVRTIPDFEVTQIDIHVVPDGKLSKCEITYTFTALSDHGREHLRGMTKEHFDAQMREWEEQVESYLARSAR
jgi:hypothetical protein